MERIYNVQKGRKKDENDGTPPQKKAKSSKLTYPDLDHLMATNPVTFDRHKAALDGELQKSHPRMEIILELMRHTYIQRRDFILSDVESVSDIMDQWGGFLFPDVVSMSLTV